MVILKNLQLTAIILILSTPVFSSFYLGGQSGGTLMRGVVNYNDPSAQQASSSNTRIIGLAYGLHLGYMYITKSHLFFFAEGYYIKESTKAKSANLIFQSNPNVPGILTFQPTSNYGAALGIGTYLNPKFDLYAKIGLENKGLKTTFTAPGQTQVISGVKKSAWAVSPGAGFSYKIIPSIAMSPEYTYVIGKSYKVLPQTTNADGTLSKSVYFTPTEHRLMLKLTYIFG